MVLKLGINEWPMPGRIVRRATYEKEYHELLQKDGVPFVPAAIWKDMLFSAAIIVAIMACAAYFGPFGPTGYPDPTIVQTIPKPDFFFLWLYAMLALLPPEMETPALLIGPVIVIGFLILLPFLSGEGEKSWRRTADRRRHAAAGRGLARDVYQACDLLAVEPRHGCLERRSVASVVSQRTHAPAAPGRTRLSGQAMPQLPLDWRLGRHARARRSTRSPPRSRMTSWCGR